MTVAEIINLTLLVGVFISALSYNRDLRLGRRDMLTLKYLIFVAVGLITGAWIIVLGVVASFKLLVDLAYHVI